VNVLLVSPEFPKTYWGAEYTTGFTGKRSAFPPLGLLTVAALLPSDCDARLEDLNVGALGDEAVRWADLVLVGAQIVQSKSFHAVVARAKALGKRVIAGGPYPTTSPARCSDADHLLLGEAEEVFSTFFEQVRAGDAPKVVQGTRPDLSKSPVPRYDLLLPGAYNSLSVQFSRGCPFHCEFCDIIEIYGRVSRSKPPEQLLAELDAIRETGHSGSLFVVDDNFIGNKGKALALVNAIERWQRAHRYPFDLFTEASINLAKEPVLLAAMVRAGFSGVFVGIETPTRRGLEEAGKSQNIHVDLDAAVDILTRAGLEVMSGFIVGFDSDDALAFERQRAFIQANPIPVAMVGLLTALPGTQLTQRLEREGRLEGIASGDQFGIPNFRTRMDRGELVRGYAHLLSLLYSPSEYYARCLRVIQRRGPSGTRFHLPSWSDVRALVMSLVHHGLAGPARGAYWRVLRAGLRRPHNLRRAIALAIAGEHFRRFTQEDVLPRLAAVDV
jgi:radical SAM superfamily enzyme YgiQ (UPF0313 family)